MGPDDKLGMDVKHVRHCGIAVVVVVAVVVVMLVLLFLLLLLLRHKKPVLAVVFYHDQWPCLMVSASFVVIRW